MCKSMHLQYDLYELLPHQKYSAYVILHFLKHYVLILILSQCGFMNSSQYGFPQVLKDHGVYMYVVYI